MFYYQLEIAGGCLAKSIFIVIFGISGLKNVGFYRPYNYPKQTTMKKTLQLMAAGAMLVSFAFVFSGCQKDNTPPVVSSVTVVPSTVDANNATTVTVVASDLDNDPLTYAYSVNGGAITGSGAVVQWTAPPTAGAYGLTVTVTDGQGGSAVGNASLTVTEPPTQIVGTASFPAGTSGDLSNSKVSLYTSYDNWLNNQPIKYGAVTGSGSSVTFALPEVNPGNYYLDIWKDNDNDAIWSIGDFVGWYGSGGLGSPSLTEIQIQQGQTITISVNMWIY